jgi:hypothetical protein
MAERQAALNCPRFAIMHCVTFATSGMKSEHSRMASGVQAWRASGVPCWAAAPPIPATAIATKSSAAGNTILQARRMVRSILFLLGFRVVGSTVRRRSLEHDPKTENQFSEKFRLRRKTAVAASFAGLDALIPGEISSVSAPGETAGSPPGFTRTRLLALHDGAFPQFRGLIVEGEMTAERAIGHRKHDVTLAVCLAGLGGRVAQHGADDLAAADEKSGGKKHQEERQHEGEARCLGAQITAPGAPGPRRAGPSRGLIRSDVGSACPSTCSHCVIRAKNRCAERKKSFWI